MLLLMMVQVTCVSVGICLWAISWQAMAAYSSQLARAKDAAISQHQPLPERRF